ncbi:MAG: YobA family protein [Firmicutes bacterium]|nr:YobA family protein [Bacillota bacterium]
MTKKILLFAAMILAAFMAVSGCADGVPEDNEDMAGPISGLIYTIEDSRILVIGGIDDVNIPQEKWFESGNRAVYFSITDETVIEVNGETVSAERLARGQAVDVFHEGFLAESYPEQGGALKIVIVNADAAGEYNTDSGKYIGITVNGEGELLEIKISGVPDEIPSKLFKITDEVREVFAGLELEPEEDIIFRYLPDSESDGLIFDLSRIVN